MSDTHSRRTVLCALAAAPAACVPALAGIAGTSEPDPLGTNFASDQNSGHLLWLGAGKDRLPTYQPING